MDFYCTAGRGTEPFVNQELSVIFKHFLDKVHITDGKVFFTVNESCTDVASRIHNLMTIERLFVLVLTQNKSDIKGKRELLTFLHTELNQNILWQNAKEILDKMKKKPMDRPPPDCLETQDIYIEPTVTKKAKLECDYSTKRDSDTENSTPKNQQILYKSNDECREETIMRQYNESSKRSSDTMVEPVTYPPPVTSPSSGDGIIIENNTLTDDPVETHPEMTFRVSCKFAGSVRHKLNPQRSVKQMGVLISKLMGWRIDLKNPANEISIHMNDEKMVVGIPVFKDPLSKRSYIRHHGLRSTVCRIMSNLALIQPGDIVMDPMCGKATILLEAFRICQTAFYLGMDISESQIKVATENIDYGHLQGTTCIQIVQGDTLSLPLPDSCVDKVITDAPFGQNHQVETDLYHFYFNMLKEVSRVLKFNGLLVLLTSTEIKDLLTHLTTKETTSTNEEKIDNSNARTNDVDGQAKTLTDSDHAMVSELSVEGRASSESKHSQAQTLTDTDHAMVGELSVEGRASSESKHSQAQTLTDTDHAMVGELSVEGKDSSESKHSQAQTLTDTDHAMVSELSFAGRDSSESKHSQTQTLTDTDYAMVSELSFEGRDSSEPKYSQAQTLTDTDHAMVGELSFEGRASSESKHSQAQTLTDTDHAMVGELSVEGKDSSESKHSQAQTTNSCLAKISQNIHQLGDKHTDESDNSRDNVTNSDFKVPSKSCGKFVTKPITCISVKDKLNQNDSFREVSALISQSCTSDITDTCTIIDKEGKLKPSANCYDSGKLNSNGTEIHECFKSDIVKLKNLFVLNQYNYVKLGATDGFVCVLQSIKNG